MLCIVHFSSFRAHQESSLAKLRATLQGREEPFIYCVAIEKERGMQSMDLLIFSPLTLPECK